jgi:transcriptional regulator of acetoin/glycerol metabolism
MKEKDIVADILGRVEQTIRAFVNQPEFKRLLAEIAQTGGGMEQRIADMLAQQIQAQDPPVRRYWAGTEPYVPQRSPKQEDAKRKAIDEARRSGKVVEASTRYGVSRAALYRALQRERGMK